jgi:nicotinamidase/pyrazinamidase
MTRKAFIIVDVQYDFTPGGALPVPDGDHVVPLINELQKKFPLVVATQDWHPANHGSFAANHNGKQPGDVVELNGLTQILWPVHCVQGTHGAEFVKELDTSRIAKVFRKGTDPEVDSYSGLFDNGHKKDTGLGDFLKDNQVRDVYVAGLATDYCVKFTALDAVRLGFRVHVLPEACRGVNLQPGDVEQSLDQMRRAGVIVE